MTSLPEKQKPEKQKPEIQKPEIQPEKRENLLLNIALNIIIPTVILTKFSGEQALGAKFGIIVALAFPISYGIYDFFRARKINFFSALGVVSIVLTGGISLLQLDPQYIAIKEATIPALFGIATVISLYTPYPLVRTFIYNDKIVQLKRVDEALEKHGSKQAFDTSLRNASLMVACSFFLSSALNYGLARYLLVSPPGTEAFNAELGKMTALSFPVISVPAMLVLLATAWYLFRSITRLTHLSLEEIIVDNEKVDNEKVDTEKS